VTTQRLLQQVSREVSTAPAFLKGVALQVIHHSTGQRHIDALRTGSIRHRCRWRDWGSLPKALLQLKNKILKKWHDSVSIFTQS
jgi:hypothetical protein